MAQSIKSTSSGADDGEQSTLFGTITVGSQSEQQNLDKVVPIVEQIKSREKENQEAVKKLRQLLAKNSKKCIKLSLSLQSKRKTVDNVSKDNEELAKAIRRAKEDLCKMQQPKKSDDSKPKSPDAKSPTRALSPDEDLEPILQSLKQLLDDLTKEIEDKEKCIKDGQSKGTKPGGTKTCEEINTLIVTKQTEVPKKKDTLQQLKRIRKAFLDKLSQLLRPRKNGAPAEKIPDFKTGVTKIIQCLDSIDALKKEVDQLKAKKNDLEKKKKDSHDKLSKRLAERKPLEALPNKVRKNFEQVAKSRPDCAPLPEQKTNLVVHLHELYDWGVKEFERDKERSDKVSKKVGDAQKRAKDDEDRRNKNKENIDNEIKDAENQLKKLEAENRDLRAQVDKANKDLEINNANRKDICGEIKTITSREQKEITIIKETRQTEIQVEYAKQRELEESRNKLRETKIRLETEVKLLEEEIRKERARCAEDKAREKERREYLEKELTNLKEKQPK